MEKLRTAAGESSAAHAIFYASLDELRALITELNTEAGRFQVRQSSLTEEPDEGHTLSEHAEETI